MKWNPFVAPDRPCILAHRGAMAKAPQNTMAAFSLARDQGADGLELDIQLSADGILMVYHDDRLSTLTNSQGRIADHPADYLETLDAGSHFGPAFAQETIPRLSRVIDSYGQAMLLNIEIKTQALEEGGLTHPKPGVGGRVAIDSQLEAAWLARIADLVAALVEELNRGPQGKGPAGFRGVIVSSFDPLALKLLYQAMPELDLAFLSWPGPELSLDTDAWVLSHLGTVLTAWHPHHSVVDQALVAAQTAAGRLIQVWTVNQPAEAQRLQALGCQTLIGNDPQALLEAFIKN